MSDDGRDEIECLRGEIVGLRLIVSLLIFHIVLRDADIRQDLIDALRNVERGNLGADHLPNSHLKGVKRSIQVVLRMILS